MIPNIDDLVLDFKEEEAEKTKTFGINFTSNVVGGTIDELEALKQSIFLLLNTEADQFIIYPYTYGLKTLDLIGKPYYYVMAIIPERIKEALSDDERIVDVSDFKFNVDKNKLHVQFVVQSIYGDVNEETVVIY